MGLTPLYSSKVSPAGVFTGPGHFQGNKKTREEA